MPTLCNQRRLGSLAVYGRLLSRDEVEPVSEPVVAETAEKPVEKTWVPAKKSEEVPADIADRLAATEKKLAELRAQSHARVKKFRAKKRRK